jgi:hypothetical protein
MNEKFNLEFTFADLTTLIKGCRELPFKESAQLIQYITTEYEKQAREKELAIQKPKEKTDKVPKA